MANRLICDRGGCDAEPDVRVYLSMQKIYVGGRGRKYLRGMGAVDLCREHFAELCRDNGFKDPTMWLGEELAVEQ